MYLMLQVYFKGINFPDQQLLLILSQAAAASLNNGSCGMRFIE